MAYQPIFCTLDDNEGGHAQSSSRKGKVSEINFWANSDFGTVMTVSVRSYGFLPRKDIYEAEEKIKRFKSEHNSKKVVEWERKLKEREEYNRKQEDDEEVRVDINLKDNPKFSFNLNGIRFSYADLKLLKETEGKDFLGKLSITSAFALIPDIKRMVNGEEGAAEAFMEKRDKLDQFFKEENAKIEAKIDGIGD